MSGVTMKEGAAAFAKFATNSWGVAASVTKGVYWESDGGMKQTPEYVDDQSFGQRFLGQAEVGNFAAQDLSLTTPMKYEGNEYILEALAMGSPNAVTISTSTASGVTSWQHIIDLSPNIDGLGVTLAFDKVLYVDELTSAKPYGFGLTADGSVMKSTFKFMGTKPTNISSINTRSTVNGASFPALRNRVLMKHGVFRCNLQSAGALGASDTITIEACDFQFSRPQDAPNPYGQDYIMEPADQGFPEFNISVTFPRMNTVTATSMNAAQAAGTVLKGDLTFTSGVFINSTDHYKVLYQFPHLEPQDTSQLATGVQQIKPTAMFKAKLAATSPTGMAFVNPMRLTRVMVNSVIAF
jgi:hypothetical protein